MRAAGRKKQHPLLKNKEEVEITQALDKRRNSKNAGYEEVIYKRVQDVKTPSKTFHQKIGYDFLQYIRIVFKWACESNNISRPNLELLLYLYPIGLFKKSDFEIFVKTLDMVHSRPFRQLQNDGWITLWRPKKHKDAALYTLSTKGKILCGKMHKICTGETSIPETKHNPIVTSTKNVDKYYLEIIKKMNQRNYKDAVDVEKETP